MSDAPHEGAMAKVRIADFGFLVPYAATVTIEAEGRRYGPLTVAGGMDLASGRITAESPGIPSALEEEVRRALLSHVRTGSVVDPEENMAGPEVTAQAEQAADEYAASSGQHAEITENV